MLIRTLVDDDPPTLKSISDTMPELATDRVSIHWLFATFFANTSFVAEEDGVVAGFLYGFIDQVRTDQAFVHALGVIEGYRGRGVGRRLLERFERAVEERGCSTVVLNTLSDNVQAQRFYRRMGFGEPVPFLKVGQPRLRLEKPIRNES
jgi:ribosomal protein S18 acetylase RimI-like enzyme